MTAILLEGSGFLFMHLALKTKEIRQRKEVPERRTFSSKNYNAFY